MTSKMAGKARESEGETKNKDRDREIKRLG